MAGMTSLPGDAFRRFDEGPDEAFYCEPRFVNHLDEAAIGAVTDLYRRFFPPGGAILDLMSSRRRHLRFDPVSRAPGRGAARSGAGAAAAGAAHHHLLQPLLSDQGDRLLAAVR